VNNYSTSVKGKSGRGVIRPQNNVPKQSVIGLRYKQTVDLQKIPVYRNGSGTPQLQEQSGFSIVLNMSNPKTTAIAQYAFGTNVPNPGVFDTSNKSATGGQDNLQQALIDSGLYDKYNHFYVRKSVVNLKIRGKPNQIKLGQTLSNHGTQTPQEHWLEVSEPSLQGDLYNFAVMSDRASVNLVDETVFNCRENTAGIKLRKSVVNQHSGGKDCSFKLVYTPKRLGIKDPMDNRNLIGFTKNTDVQENSFAQFIIGKQMFPDNSLDSALSVVDFAIDYEIIACERRITDNDPVMRPLPGRDRHEL